MKNQFKKDSFVVMEHAWDEGYNDSSSFKKDYIYQLREDSNNYCFRVSKDLVGSQTNGWNPHNAGRRWAR